MSELENIVASQIIDARGTSCPGPILEAQKGISKVKVGEILEIRASDPATKDDLPVWVKRVGHEYLGTLEGEGFFRLFIKRRK